MNIKTTAFIFAMIGLTACTSVKEQLGVTREAPDEFAVVKRAPLELPSNVTALPKPQLGAPRPQEQETFVQAKQNLFGSAADSATAPEIKEQEQYAGFSEGNNSFLKKAGAQNIDPNIRRKVDLETEKLSKEKIPVARKLFGLGGDPDKAPAKVVNAKEEAERIQKNKALGKPVLTGETPTIEK